jgi:hypothetical protein
MSGQNTSADALLTEHFRYTPLVRIPTSRPSTAYSLTRPTVPDRRHNQHSKHDSLPGSDRDRVRAAQYIARQTRLRSPTVLHQRRRCTATSGRRRTSGDRRRSTPAGNTIRSHGGQDFRQVRDLYLAQYPHNTRWTGEVDTARALRGTILGRNT